MKLSDYEYYRTDLGVLYCGDCLEILPLIDKVDLVLTDPPYEQTKCEWDNNLENILKEIKSNSQVVFGNIKNFFIISKILDFRFEMIWDKINPSNFANAKIMPLRQHEYIYICGDYKYFPVCDTNKTIGKFGKDYCKYGDETEKTVGKMGLEYNIGKGYPKTIISIIKPNNLTGGGFHPTQKPVDLIVYLLRNFSDNNFNILDPCLGSGTTAVACEKLGRRWIGIEISEKYCEIAKQRIKNEADQFKLL
jgi:site-specific DNA-methyltransferase (adenine-specific)